MSGTRKRSGAPPALDLVEEAVHLVRRAGWGPIVCYYAGGLPFILGLLYFWSDMSRGAFAAQRAVQAAFSMAVLFVWMKCWHAVFAAELRERLLDRQGEVWGLRRVVGLLAVQGALQPSGLFLRPLAILTMFPYGWVRAYYENVTALGDGRSAGTRTVARRAREQAMLWGLQNHASLSILFAFGFFVWLDIAVAMYLAPWLLRTFLGIETQLSRSGLGMLNTTWFFASVAGAHLCVDPFFKAFYVVRCFYGESLRSGEDLLVRLRQASTGRTVAMLTFAGLLLGTGSGLAEEQSRAIDSAKLDRTIDQVLDHREYTWRMPPPPNQDEKTSFVSGLAKMLLKPVKGLFRKMRQFDEWLRDLLKKLFPGRDHGPEGANGWLQSLPWILYAVAGIAALLIGSLVVKRWRENRNRRQAIAEPVPAIPDLASDQVSADELPEDGWMRLAQEMTVKGELRFALRALYLAGLAHLGSRRLITLARHKSDRDYSRELERRARLDESLQVAFGESLMAFERSWYGSHAVNSGTLEDFQRNLERIRAC